MKIAILLAGLLSVSLPVSAAMYKCTDTDGSITFKDKPCDGQAQELLKKKTFSKPRPEPANLKPIKTKSSETSSRFEPIKPLPGGKKVTSSSPLGRTYMKFLHALNHCDRDRMMQYSSGSMAEGMKTANNLEFKTGCRLLQDFMPSNLDDATEVIEGNSGKIQWLSVKSNTDSSGLTEKFTSEHTEEFVKEGGVWKLSH